MWMKENFMAFEAIACMLYLTCTHNAAATTTQTSNQRNEWTDRQTHRQKLRLRLRLRLICISVLEIVIGHQRADKYKNTRCGPCDLAVPIIIPLSRLRGPVLLACAF